jgi:nicotinate-nucleotide pyrophosphorylase (carboxylating)
LAERLVLNTMQRMSGVATTARMYADAVKDFPVQILDTRKTMPLNRFLQKWAVQIGGCSNYRFGLFDRIMIKDNHVDASGGMQEAIERVQDYLKEMGKSLEMTVEVRDLEELELVMGYDSVNRVMLDNFSMEDMRIAVARVDKKKEVEASGGITLDVLKEVASTGVDFISVGALTHSAPSLDLSLKVRK